MRTISNNFRTGTVTQASYERGSAVFDVRLNEGAHYRGVPLASKGTSLFPPTVGQVVHLIFPHGPYDLPYIVGADQTTIPQTTDSADESSDYLPDSADLVLRHAGQTLSLSDSGITIDPTATARIQLNSNQKLRVSEDGVADNQVLNADPFLDELYSYIASLELTITNIQTHLKVLNSQLLGSYPAIAFTIPQSETPPPPSPASKLRAQATKNSAILIP